ncbi:hypothetical protein [Streptomyces sp. NRRL F-5126]|nr:hypothetical protein [Streptomyces sp. NRRL F-5126]
MNDTTRDDDEFVLNVRLVDAGPVASVVSSEDCTGDGCGPTPCGPGADL